MASVTQIDTFVALSLHPDEPREAVSDEPDEWRIGGPLLFLWDGQKLDQGIWELLGVEVTDVTRLREEHLCQLDELDLPRVDVPEAGLRDVPLSTALRWATQPSERQAGAAPAGALVTGGGD